MVKFQELKLKGKAIVFIDWANVYNWRKELKKDPDPKKILHYLKLYKEITEVRFYFGIEIKEKTSLKFIKTIQTLGYFLVTKPVKFLKVFNKDKKTYLLKRKYDFDLEIVLDALELSCIYDSFIFFSGDGDFATLYERLINKGKQVIVVYAKNRLGREIWDMKKKIFKIEFPKLNIKNVP